MRKNNGFSLIELMIVVAIIGILAAIAVPNYLKFTAKTKRSEVKYNLEAIYKAEICWYGEHNSFSNNFNTIRWEPTGAIYYYTFSLGAGTKGLSPAVNPNPGVSPFGNDNSFAAYGWGNIYNDNTAKDVWHIDEMKNLVNDVDDLNT